MFGSLALKDKAKKWSEGLTSKIVTGKFVGVEGLTSLEWTMEVGGGEGLTSRNNHGKIVWL